MTKSGGQFALVSALQILGDSSPVPPVIYAHDCMINTGRSLYIYFTWYTTYIHQVSP